MKCHNAHKPTSLNHTYRLVWSEESQGFVPASETKKTKNRSAGGVNGLIAGLMLAFSSTAWAVNPGALPDGVTVAHGDATFTRNGNELIIQQGSERLITQWDTFNIGQDALVRFNQPNSQSAALNRIQDQNPSQILGRLESNGQVYLVNPNGILFGQNAQVDVGGLIASTLDISDDDFLAGRLNFKQNGLAKGQIENLGHIQANGGVVALIANQVSNQGTIHSDLGNVTLAAGDQVTLDFNGDGLMTVTVEQGVIDALAENGGLIQADGGFVLMTTQAQNDIYRNVVNNTGIIQAQTLGQDQTGRIMLMGGMNQGQTIAGGTLDASAPTTGDGGFIETSAANVQIQSDLKVTTRAENGQTGEWLIDPNDYTVAAEGGDITGTALGSLLADNNITIQTIVGTNDANNLYATEEGNGDIFVNDEVTWSSGNTLTLNAIRNIQINSEIDASQGDGGRLVLEYGQGAADGVINGQQAYYLINAPVSLQPSGAANGVNTTATNFATKLGSAGTAIHFTTITDNDGANLNTQLSNNLSGNFALSTHITLTGADNWTSVAADIYQGRFEGLGHSLSGLNISSDSDYAGMFGQIGSNAYIGNFNLKNASVSSSAEIAGALVGQTNLGSQIFNTSATGVAVHGNIAIGGLVGRNRGSISNSYATGAITGSGTGSVFVGGLVGVSHGPISNSYATGTVTGTGSNYVGGLVGASRGSISSSYATATVTGSVAVGGLVGLNTTDGSVSNSYATGTVTGSTAVGGLVGWTLYNNSVSNSYATGTVTVTGAGSVGGLVGQTHNDTSISNSFWNSTANSGLSGGAGTAKTEIELMTAETFISAGWDQDVWSLLAGGASVEGYEIGSGLPYLTNVTRSEDIVEGSVTLFAGGWGGQTDVQQAGANGSAYTITNWNQLQNINLVVNQGFDFTLSNSLDTSSAGYTEQASATANDNTGWQPIGAAADGNRFNGSFDGNGQTISDLFINRPSENDIGLFGGTATGSTIENLGIVEASITGNDQVGILVGQSSGSTIKNSFATGSVEGTDNVGGLVGLLDGGSIVRSYANGEVNGHSSIGGLVGKTSDGSITNTYAAGRVTGSNRVGGLVGDSSELTTTSSFWNTTANSSLNGVGHGDTPVGLVGKTETQLKTLSTFIDAGWDISDTGGEDKVWRIYGGNTAPLLRVFLTPLTFNNGTPVEKVYDNTDSFVFDDLNWSEEPEQDLLLGSSEAVMSDVNVGTHSLTSGLYSTQLGYDLITPKTVTITAREITVTADDKQKIYGNTDPDLTWQVTVGELLNGDNLTGILTRDAGENVGTYSISPGALENTNYDITFINGTLTINTRPITVTPNSVTRVYDGTTNAIGTVTIDDLVSDDNVEQITLQFDNKNVGTNKTLTASGLTIQNASDEDMTNNYSITFVANNTSSITRLDSVTWTGGETGDWFNPANWGGAVPDLANVANVIIPENVAVTFGDTVTTPAEAGPVEIDSLTGGGSSAGSLNQTAGSLNVGSGGIKLANLTLNDGTLTNAGTTSVTSFMQTGGTAALDDDFTVSDGFAQGDSGSVTVTGAANISDSNDGIVLGNLTADNLSVTSTGGAITQADATMLDMAGLATFNASNGLDAKGNPIAADITLTNNNQLTTVNATGATINMTNTNALTLGTVVTTGDLTLQSNGALNLGSSTVGGNLDANSGNGNIIQNGSLNVTGTTGLAAGTGDINLNDEDNAFGDQVTAEGNTINLAASGDLDADVTAVSDATLNATGNLVADVTAGNDSTLNAGGTLSAELAVTGNSTLTSVDNLSIKGSSQNLITTTTGENSHTSFGDTTVHGSLSAETNNGNIIQNGSLNVTGTTGLAAGTGNIDLSNPANDFVGPVGAEGKDIFLSNGVAGIILGNINAGGRLEVESTDGDISQADGTTVRSVGEPLFKALGFDIDVNIHTGVSASPATEIGTQITKLVSNQAYRQAHQDIQQAAASDPVGETNQTRLQIAANTGSSAIELIMQSTVIRDMRTQQPATEALPTDDSD